MSFSGVLPGSYYKAVKLCFFSTGETFGNVIWFPIKLLRFFSKFFFLQINK